MIECSIKGCEEICADDGRDLDRWVILRACHCGAYDLRDPKSCTCPAHPESKVKITYWPMLDWWLLGGVEQVILCPQHRREVYREIVLQRVLDPSMNPGGGQNPTNRH